jgi:hypothetical protein
MDNQTRADAAAYVAALVDTEPKSDYGTPNERTLYQLPTDRNRLVALLRSGNDGWDSPPWMLASTCLLEDERPPVGDFHGGAGGDGNRLNPDAGYGNVIGGPAGHVHRNAASAMRVCRPGTGLWNVGLPSDRMPAPSQAPEASTGVGAEPRRELQGGSATGPWPGYHPVPVGTHCNWSAAVYTNIPDGHSRAHGARFPAGIYTRGCHWFPHLLASFKRAGV